MKDKQSEKNISLFQVFALMIRAMLGVSVLTIPAVVARELGHNGWLVIIGLALVIIGFYLVAIKALKKWPQVNFVEVLHKVWGKYLGSLMALTIIAYLLYVVATVSRAFADNLHTWFLNRTPPLVLTGTHLFLKVYASLQTVPGFARLIELIFVILLPLILLLLPIFGEVRWIYLRPLLTGDMLQLFLPLYRLIPIFLGFEIVIYYNNVLPKRKLLHVGIGAILFSMLIYIFLAVSVIGFFGPTLTAESLYPVQDVLRAIPVPVIERLDIFFVFFWNFALFSTGAVYFYTAVLLFKQLFDISRDRLIFVAVPLGLAELVVATRFENLFMIGGPALATVWYGIGYLIIIMLTCVIALFKKDKRSS